MPSIDLTTLPGWSSLSAGTHDITIGAKANGYRDSEPSAAVSVTKQGGGGTVIKAGTYRWVDTPDIQGITDITGDYGGFDGQFKSSDINFDTIEFSVALNLITYYPPENFTSLIGNQEVTECGYLDGQWEVASSSGEIREVPALQTFTILEDINLTSEWNDTEIEQAILTWFTANTTKLS